MRIFKSIILSCLFLISISISAQVPNFNWAKHIGAAGTVVKSQDISTDNIGNVYTAGWFSGTVDFDPNVGSQYLSSNGYYDIFIQKLSPSGVLLWVKQIGSASREEAKAISTDQIGNIYITGTFEGTVDFNPGSSSFNMTSSGNFDIFIMKLDSTGDFQWAKQLGGIAYDYSAEIVYDNYGNVYVTGGFRDTIDFDPGAGIHFLSSGGNMDIFVLKLDANGNFIWAHNWGVSLNDLGNSVFIDLNGNVYLTGYFFGSIDFDPDTGTYIVHSAGQEDIFVLKLDSNSSFLWAHQMGGAYDDHGLSIATDMYNNVYTTGTFNWVADFFPGYGVYQLMAIGPDDIFIHKFDVNGNFKWVKHLGGTGFKDVNRIIVNDIGEMYISGSFNGTLDCDPDTGTYNLISAGDYDIFNVKLDTSGALLWAFQTGSVWTDEASSFAIDQNRNIYVTGGFMNTVDFDPGTSTYNLSCVGMSDMFVQKLSQCTTNPGTDVINACYYYTWIDGNTYYANNNTATHTLINSNGCDSTVTLNLTIDTVNTEVNVNGPTLVAQATPANYQWGTCGAIFTPISGETNQVFTPTQNGNYAVEISQNGCTEFSECITVNNVGIDEYESKFSLYPNPTKSVINIECIEYPIQVTLYSTESKILNTWHFKNKSNKIYLNIARGFYFLKIQSTAYTRTLKIVVE